MVKFPCGREMTINGPISGRVRKGRRYKNGKVTSVIRKGVTMVLRKTDAGVVYADCTAPAPKGDNVIGKMVSVEKLISVKAAVRANA